MKLVIKNQLSSQSLYESPFENNFVARENVSNIIRSVIDECHTFDENRRIDKL